MIEKKFISYLTLGDVIIKSISVTSRWKSLNNLPVFFPSDPFQQSLDSQYSSFFAAPWEVFYCQHHQV